VKKNFFSFALLVISSSLFVHSFCAIAWAKPHGDVRNELPTPVNLQAVTLNKAITLTWQWQKPEELPVFLEFGYELKRQDGKTFSVSDNTYADTNLSPSSYTYIVRARGLAKEKGKRITYVSDWSEPASGFIKTTCPRPPTINLTVEPTQKKYERISALRFHIQGLASVDTGCTLGAVRYHLDTGTGIVHGGPLPVDAHGHFDTFAYAFGPEDEVPSGLTTFSITASAEDEAGPATSTVYTIDLELENRFAPHTP
jgi:hypothetical protein